jgi:diguanylate cyclase (GGDEF)-like protein/PAS domain S-box-containing protein
MIPNFHLKHMELFFQVFNKMSDMVFLTEFVKEKEFRYVIANEPAKKFVGLTDESFGKTIREIMPEEAYKLIEVQYIKAITKKEPIIYEEKVQVPTYLANLQNYKYSKDEMIYWESTITPVLNQDGSCTHLLAVVRDITDRKIREKEFISVKNRLELIWNSAADPMFIFDKAENFIGVNNAFENLFGWTENEILIDPSISIISRKSKADLKVVMDKLKIGEIIPSHEVKCRTKDGELINILASYSPVYDQNGNWDGAVVVYKDITERSKMLQELIESERRYRIIADHSNELIKVVDIEGTILYASPSHMKVLNISPDYFLYKSIHSLAHTDQKLKMKQTLKKIIETKENISLDYKMLNDHGEWIWVHTIGSPILDEEGDVQRIVFEARDITERRKYEEKLKYIAHHDHLTGLPNRAMFSKRLKEELENARQSKSILSIMLLDLDKFKQINDTFGHNIGDELLRSFTTRVKTCLREIDLMARLGGDEFVIMLPMLNDKNLAIETADRILQSLQGDWFFEEHVFSTTSSIGISFYPPYDQDPKMLLKNADIALYKAKKNGRNNYQLI